MAHYLNYIVHKTINPLYNYIQTNHILPSASDPSQKSVVERAVFISIPFLSLYKPFGKGVGLIIGSGRVITHLSHAVAAARKRELSTCGAKLILTSLSAVSVASTFFHHRLGILVTTGTDMIQNASAMRRFYIEGDRKRLSEEAIQLTTSSLYLAIMVTGSLEITLLSLMLQVGLNAYQSREEWNEGKKPEAIAKFLMGCFRLYEVKQKWGELQRRNELLNNPLFKQLVLLIKESRRFESLVSSPLSDLLKKIPENRAILEGAEGKKYDCGAHFHGFGKGLVKGANICVKSKTIDGKEMLELDFKINHAFRDQLEQAISNLLSISIAPNFSEMLALTHSHIKGLEITKGDFDIGGFIKKAYQISFPGIGSILVGADPEVTALYNRVMVRVFQSCNLFHLHEMLSFVHLEEALQIFNKEDLERLKLGLLFRTFFPKEGSLFERTMEFFKLPLAELKNKIMNMAPPHVMQEIFERYLPRIRPYEILPGRIRYGIEGLGDICYRLGARVLMSSIWINSSNEGAVFNRIVSILKMGMLSTEMRFGNQINVKGLSSDADIETGGSDGAFTQLVPSTYHNGAPVAKAFGYYYRGIAITFDLSLLDTGSYQYHTDSFGTRNLLHDESIYLNRPNIFDFVMWERANLNDSNEVMIKDRIPPSFISGIVVSDQALLEQLTDHLRKAGLIQINSEGVETIFNIPVTTFIRAPADVEKRFLQGFFLQNAIFKLYAKLKNSISPFL